MPSQAAAAGLAWVAWPCGLLQSGLVVAALSSSPAGGALAMGGFALASMPGLLAGGWLFDRLTKWRAVSRRNPNFALGLAAFAEVQVSASGAQQLADVGAAGQRLAIRVAGALLAGASAWAIGHQFGPAFMAFCSTL